MLSSITNTKYADHHPPGPTDNTSVMLKMCFLANRGFVTFRGGGGGFYGKSFVNFEGMST